VYFTHTSSVFSIKIWSKSKSEESFTWLFSLKHSESTTTHKKHKTFENWSDQCYVYIIMKEDQREKNSVLKKKEYVIVMSQEDSVQI
jgi:hypothetical protein